VIINIAGYDVLIDDEDFEKVNVHNWCIFHSRGRTPYVIKQILKNGKRHRVFLHRMVIGAPEGKEIDHVNGNTLDNRKMNLRICDHAENVKNCKKNKKNTSGFKGVYFLKKNMKYRALIKNNGKRIHLGLFDTPEEAHKAYCDASKKYHGEFGRTE
jgi:hypothetical protein